MYYITWKQAKDAFDKTLKNAGKDFYTIDVVLNKETETIKFRKEYLDDIIEETISGHPSCTLYAEAVRRLIDEQAYGEHKYPKLDWKKYNEIKWRMLNEDTPVDMGVVEELRALGPNPTWNIDPEDIIKIKKGGKATRFYWNIILNKQWMSKRDIGKNKSDIIYEMRKALIENPETAFITNRYLPSILSIYREK